MAIRNIRISTDEVLRKTCKPIKEITPNLLTLLDDMADIRRLRTMKAVEMSLRLMI